MIEQEKKFILKYLPKTSVGVNIKQGYLTVDGNRGLRVRIVDDKTAYMTFKIYKSSTIRNEYEYEIPLQDAIELYQNSLYRITKIRYTTTFEGNHVDIDVYESGKRVVEIEFKDQLVNLPDYCGEDISDDKTWSNLYMAMQLKN